MVEFDEEFDKPSNSNKPDRLPSLPDELLNAFHAFSTVPLEFRLPYLLFLDGLDSTVIAFALNVRYSEVEKRIAETKDILLRYVVSSVDIEIERRDSPRPNNPDYAKSDFIRNLIEEVPGDLFEAYRRYRQNETVEDIARQCGITEEEVVRFHRMTLLSFLDRINRTVRHLAEIDADSPPPFDAMFDLAKKVREIRQTVSTATEAIKRLESESVPTLSRDELLEIRMLYYGLDAIHREPFELSAVEIGREEIADVLDIDPETVRIRLKKARRFLVAQVERLIVSMLLKRKKSPRAPRMRRQSYSTAQAMYREIPENSRKAYALFMTTGYSHDEIALRLDLSEEEVERRIKEARRVIRKRVLTAGILAVRKGEDVPTARKRILTRLRYIMALRQGHRQKKFLEAREAIKPLEKLTESERRETALLFEKLGKEQRETYALCKGLEIDPLEVADFLGFLESEVRSTIRSVHASCTDRLIQLIGGMLRIDSFLPDAPPLPESAIETARKAWQFVGEKNEEVFRRYFGSNDSEGEVAEALGLDPAEVADRIDGIRSMLSIRSEILLVSWLREKENGLMRAELILRDIPERPDVPVVASPQVTEEPEEPYDYNAFTASELIEAKKTLALLDYDCRETFILHLGTGMAKEKVAELQKITVEELDRRLLDAKEMIRARMEQMVLGMLRVSWELPDAPRMKDTEYEAAKGAFEFVPQQCRKSYIRFRIYGESVDEIAGKLHVRVDKVKDRLLEADRVIFTRALFFAVAATKEQDEGKQVAEELLGDPKSIRFPAEVWNKDSSGPATEKLQAIDTPQAGTEQGKKKSRNPVMTALAVLASLPTQLGASLPNPETMAVVGLWVAIPTAASVYMGPFAWVFWMIFTEFVYGRTFIRLAPTVQAKQRFVEQLFWLYTTCLVLPFTFPVIISVARKQFGLEFDRTGFALFLLFFVTNGTLFIRAIQYCNSWREPNQVSSDQAGNARRLSLILNLGFAVNTLVIATVLFWFAQDAVFYRIGKPGANVFVAIFAIVTCLLFSLQGGIYLMFRYFYRISKDEAAIQEYRPGWLARQSFWGSRDFEEFIRFAPFAAWLILGNLYHVLFVQLHTGGSLFEIGLYTCGWALVWRMNIKWIAGKAILHDIARWLCVLGMFLVQYAIHSVLRNYFY